MKFLFCVPNKDQVATKIDGGTMFHYPPTVIVEKEANSSDDLGLKYVNFIPGGTEESARERVSLSTVVSLFPSLGQSTARNEVPPLCGIGIYRQKA